MSTTIVSASKVAESDIPRLEGTSTHKHWEFKSFKSLLNCLDQGVFVFGIQQKKLKDDRTYYNLRGCLGGYEYYPIYVALQTNTLTEKSYGKSNSTSIIYELLQESAVNYALRKDDEDTADTYKQILTHLQPAFLEIRHQLFPADMSESWHQPNQLKMKKLKGINTKTITKEGVKDQVADFNLSELIARTGLLMVNLNTPWWFLNSSQNDIQMGLTVDLLRSKYYNAEQKRLAEQRARESRVRSSTSSEPAKKKVALSEPEPTSA